MNTSRRVWMPCTTSKGMFSSEAAVEITVGEKKISFFADRSLIKKIGGKQYILVTEIGDNGQPQHKTILLPSETLETGSRWLSVDQRLLKVAA